MMAPLAAAIMFFLGAALAGNAFGQEAPSEDIQIGLSTDRVSITSDFAGANLTIFGAVDDIDPLISRQGGYDVIVVLEGPPRTTVVRKKTRVLGMWINTHSLVFRDVPASYSVALTRQPQDITDTANYERLALRVENVRLQPLDADGNPQTIEEFTAALRARKLAAGLYVERPGGVQFLSRSLFRATLQLAPNVPVGTHRARAFLFRNGTFVRETSAALTIRKAGIEQRIFEFAHQNGLLYGLGAVFVAIVTGWVGRMVFRRD
ncbi:TIGR02186 family protein [Nitratireductor sp. GCM10026969]|uniref:TIGR02186 family protein n=1 Tax=Nitratireductor sp. GCM10026969 TaxID=3252645 RepID=UPI003619DF84